MVKMLSKKTEQTVQDGNRGARIRTIRKALGETLNQFGSRFQINGVSISRYEKGRMPSDAVLMRLAEMGYSIDWLLTGEGSMKRADRRGPDIIYPDQAVANEYMRVRDADLPPGEKDRRLLFLIKELVNEFLDNSKEEKKKE